MSKKLEDWLQATSATVSETSTPPPALFKRLRYVADIVAGAGPLAAEPQLLYRTAEKKIHSVKIGQELVVGRAPPAHLVFNDDLYLSRRHFKIRKLGDGEQIEDLCSNNGTLVNGVKIESDGLRDGDIIKAGHHLFVFLRRLADL